MESLKRDDNLAYMIKRYKKSGIFKSCIIPTELHNAFFELFERNKFSYYVCDRLKDSKEDEVPS